MLMRAARWFDLNSLAELEKRGWPRLSPAQSLLFAHLDEQGTPPAEVARRLSQTRQATQDLVAGLTRLGLLVVTDDPARRGGRLVCLTVAGRDLVGDAYSILMAMEAAVGSQLVERLRARLSDVLAGQERVDARRAGLS